LRVLATSDLHGAVAWLKRALAYAEEQGLHTVVCCGDFQSVEAVKVLAGFKGRAFAVPGNMDSREEAEALEEAGVSLHRRAVEHGGFIFAGAGALGFKDALASIGASLPSSPSRLVLITHVPPKGLKVDLALNLMHIGSGALRSFIEARKPLACICGHVHEARGLDWLGSTLVVNPGPLAKGYAAIVDLARGRAELVSLEP
jgi:Icc-related predicted phosphoesterase